MLNERPRERRSASQQPCFDQWRLAAHRPRHAPGPFTAPHPLSHTTAFCLSISALLSSLARSSIVGRRRRALLTLHRGECFAMLPSIASGTYHYPQPPHPPSFFGSTGDFPVHQLCPLCHYPFWAPLSPGMSGTLLDNASLTVFLLPFHRSARLDVPCRRRWLQRVRPLRHASHHRGPFWPLPEVYFKPTELVPSVNSHPPKMTRALGRARGEPKVQPNR
jgi:hypothetical protein